MTQVIHAAALIARQVDADAAATTTVPLAGQPGHCDKGNDYNGSLGVRISAIFVILVTSLFGRYSQKYVACILY
jgi:zinc transporter 1/2/3